MSDLCSPPLSAVPDLWFDDGNIVIVAGSWSFRLRRGILAFQSSVFRDMFSLPPSGSQDVYDGCPLINVSDDPNDMEHFLKAVYFPQYFPPGISQEVEFGVLRAVLGLAQKFDVPFLRRRALCILSDAYSTDADGGRRDHPSLDCLLAEIALAREVNAIWLLPRLYYEVSYADASDIIIGCQEASDKELRNSVLILCFAGLQRIRAAFEPNFMINPASSCSSRAKCTQRRWIAFGKTFHLRDTPQLFFSYSFTEDVDSGACASCQVAIITDLHTRRKELWDAIPGFYGLLDWDRLKEMKREETSLKGSAWGEVICS
ncbi:hypothetical protein BD626DRAFT_527591 [Schizophyllum amplum]|uniref:BTB domain-containing protein n=1 Tax=Schizophyllum amplum TaxID=97359 RepID=A0A550BS68_9AGAR|nr:hypothetical protein BD626DRAFT_527591 [Auriculariopsis ampla]